MMALTHDLAESVVGDLTPYDSVTPEEKQIREREAIKTICSAIEQKRAAELIALWEEYEEGNMNHILSQNLNTVVNEEG